MMRTLNFVIKKENIIIHVTNNVYINRKYGWKIITNNRNLEGIIIPILNLKIHYSEKMEKQQKKQTVIILDNTKDF